MPSREYRLKEALAPIKDDYHTILVDCPPSLGLLTLNALTAADSVFQLAKPLIFGMTVALLPIGWTPLWNGPSYKPASRWRAATGC